MSVKPKLTVGLPVYNGEPFLADSIDSILRQTLGDFELIISDNASTDNTEEICRGYGAKDNRVRYIRNPDNIGAAANYNRLVEAASADYFRWQNADDLSEPQLHETCLEALEANADAVLCCGKTSCIDPNGDVRPELDGGMNLVSESASARLIQFFKSYRLTNAIYGLMRTDAMRRTALMGDGSFPAADINFMGELCLYGKFIELPERLFLRRMHEGASSWDRSDDKVQKKFWSGGGSEFAFGNWRRYRAYLRAIDKAPISFAVKWRSRRYILREAWGTRGALFGDVVDALRRRRGSQT